MWIRRIRQKAARAFPQFGRLLLRVPVPGVWRRSALILTVKPYTIMSYRKLSTLADIARDLRRRGIAGSFVECGVRNGGSAGILAAEASRRPVRPVWLFDSWEGVPEPTDADIAMPTGQPGQRGMFLGAQQKVEELFTKLRLRREHIHLIKGWFSESIPPHKDQMRQIAFLLLDCTLYESYKFCLEELYDSVATGGTIWIDDYGTWQGCKRAVDEFLRERRPDVQPVKVWEGAGRTYRAVYFQK